MSTVSDIAIKGAVRGHELEILDALGIDRRAGNPHIRCPYPNHPDKHESWRWSQKDARAFCSCSTEDIFGVISKVRSVDFAAAKVFAAEAIGRRDLILEPMRRAQHQDAASLLGAPTDNRDDGLPFAYLAFRLGVIPAEVPRPSTRVAGLKQNPYKAADKKFELHSCAIFEMRSAQGGDSCTAQRIYVAPRGQGKAAVADPKRLAPGKISGECCWWGNPCRTTFAILCEGIETGAAIARAFRAELEAGDLCVGAATSSKNLVKVALPANIKNVCIGADRDEGKAASDAGFREGEQAARKFGAANSSTPVHIALPGQSGEQIDWLDVLRRGGIEAVRAGFVSAVKYEPAEEELGGGDRQGAAIADAPLDDPSAEAEIDRLSKLSDLAYARQLPGSAKAIGVKQSMLDRLVKAKRRESEEPVETLGQGRPIELPEIEPWAEPVDGAALLDAAMAAIAQYVILSDIQRDAVTLWSVYTHAFDASDTNPKLIVKSPQKRSGKSRLAEVLTRTTARPLYVSGITPAALLRIIEMHRPTILLDEMDAAMKQSEGMAEALRGLMNSGFTRAGACYVMNVPVDGGYEPRAFSTWCPQFLSGIGNLPDTVRDRSIEIEMKRKLPSEKVKRLRQRDGADLQLVARMSVRWAADDKAKLSAAEPAIPPGLNDRAADTWEPLFAIADLAGGGWPERARRAALALSGDGVVEDGNIGTKLLGDIRRAFAESKVDRLSSEDLAAYLATLDDRPWPEWKGGAPITKVQLSRMLARYKVFSETIRLKDTTAKGYYLTAFADAFARYLLPENPDPKRHAVTTSEPSALPVDSGSVTIGQCDVVENAKKPSSDGHCNGVTDRNPSLEDEERAAIREYDGGLPRDQAERTARDEENHG
jgi:Protein of unknown function (DUF3631)/Toprim domain